MVSSSFTGNLHPTPCIDWMQGKRGDPGCMAKAFMHPLQHVIAARVCHYAHTHTLLSMYCCRVVIASVYYYTVLHARLGCLSPLAPPSSRIP